MKNNKNAFTMIELVFVIVILGILAAIAVPKFAATRTDAEIAKGRADISAIRSSIVSERQARLIQGQSSWITKLSTTTTKLFDGNGSSSLLMYGVTAGAGSGHWQSTSGTAYTYTIQSIAVPFTYTSTNGIFECNTTAAITGDTCKQLTN